ncbi:glutamate acetyltransferase [Nostoc sp. FACHB-892]|nr:glutamate acetyltransferase [Nostoc sp. FACHB-892]
MHYKLLVSKYTSVKQLIYSYFVKTLSINTYKEKIIFTKNEINHLYKDRDDSRVLYISSVVLRLSKSQNRKTMELADAIASDLLKICDDVFSVQIVPPGWIHFELTDSTLATWLQSLIERSLGGAGEAGEPGEDERDEEDKANNQCAMSDSLFAVQYAHARCCSLVLLAHREGLIKLREPVPNTSPAFWDVISPNPLPWLNGDGRLRLNHPNERRLIAELVKVVDNIECADIKGSVKWEKVALSLSQAFENFWSNCRIWGEVKITSPELTQARLGLLMATQSVLRFVLEESLGIIAPLEL